MRKHMVFGLVLGLMLLVPAAARAQFEMVQPVSFTGPLSHPAYEEGGWFVGADFLYLAKVFGTFNGAAPDSILSVGYRTESGNVYQISWWDQWFSPTLAPTQRLQIIDFSARFKTFDNGCYRQFGTFGPRVILESQDFFLPLTTYTVDNNMFGLYIGCMNEWYLGTNPLGAWSFILDGDIGAYANIVRGATALQTANSFTLSGSLQGKAGFIWYVWEGISIHFGLQVLSIINLQQNLNPVIAGGNVSGTLTPTMPVWIGGYLAAGFVF